MTEVQFNNGTITVSPTTISFTATPTDGNLIVFAFIETASSPNTAYAISGFTADVVGAGGGAVLSKVASSETNSYSVSYTGTSGVKWIGAEVSGQAAAAYFDQHNDGNLASGTSWVLTTVGALAQAEEWGVVAIGFNGNIDTTTQAFDNSWVLQAGQNSRRAYATKVITAGSGTESTTFSYTGVARAGQYVMATYKAAAAGAPTLPRVLVRSQAVHRASRW